MAQAHYGQKNRHPRVMRRDHDAIRGIQSIGRRRKPHRITTRSRQDRCLPRRRSRSHNVRHIRQCRRDPRNRPREALTRSLQRH